MKLTPTLLTLATCAHCGLQAAQTWEVDAGAAFTEWNVLDVTTWHAGAAYYLDPLTLTGSEPLAEAAFIERPRSLQAAFQQTEASIDEPSWSEEETHMTAEFGYHHRSASSPHAFFIGYGYTDSSMQSRWMQFPAPTPVTKATGYTHAFRGGYDFYLKPRLTLGIAGSYEYEWRDGDGIDWDTEEYDLAVRLRYLHSLNGRQWLALAASAGQTDTRSTYRNNPWPDDHYSHDFSHVEASLDFYFSRHTSLGVMWGTENRADTETVGIQAEHFFTESVAVSVTVQRVRDDAGPDADLVAGGLRCRF